MILNLDFAKMISPVIMIVDYKYNQSDLFAEYSQILRNKSLFLNESLIKSFLKLLQKNDFHVPDQW